MFDQTKSWGRDRESAPSPFSLPAYLELVDALRGRGYRLCALRDVLSSGEEQIAFMRHDVDIDLRAAVGLAECEAEAGVSSTYFISLQSPFLNVWASPSLDRLERIASLGHELAPHLDLRAMPSARAALEAVRNLCPAFRTDYVSVHSPTPDMPPVQAVGARDVQELCKQMGFKYLSDSTGVWREGPPAQHGAARAGISLHLNTHPIWWFEDGSTPQAQMLRAVAAGVEHGPDAAWWFPKLARSACVSVEGAEMMGASGIGPNGGAR
jgi:hypothetical protein